ncbi:MAG: diacylglycerol kinase family protein, partial [Chloroflexi bacterium]|nr:diacylglycerol kinase family protein [Chloroflexota bacterium]
VLASEAFNTAQEFLADAVQPNHDSLIGRAKDVAAGAVLLTSLGAAAVGLLIFLPHVLRMVRG